MANNLQTLRALALCQCAVGFVMLVFGMVDRGVVHFWTSHIGFAIWIGAWITVTGILGCFASSRQRTSPNIPLVGTYLGFSITSTVLAGIIIICYSVVLSIKSDEWRKRNKIIDYEYDWDDYNTPRVPVLQGYDSVDYFDGGTYLSGKSGYETSMAISSIILIMGVLQFFLGIWSAVCCCQGFGCQCCAIEQEQAQAGQVMYVTNQGAPVMTQVVTQNPGDSRMHSAPMSVVPTSGGTMMAVPVQVASPGQQMMAVQMPHAGSPMMAMPVSASGAPVVAVPASSMSQVAVPVGTAQFQAQGVVDASLTMDQHVNV